MGLPRHDGEVEGVVLSWRMMRLGTFDDAFTDHHNA